MWDSSSRSRDADVRRVDSDGVVGNSRDRRVFTCGWAAGEAEPPSVGASRRGRSAEPCRAVPASNHQPRDALPARPGRRRLRPVPVRPRISFLLLFRSSWSSDRESVTVPLHLRSSKCNSAVPRRICYSIRGWSQHVQGAPIHPAWTIVPPIIGTSIIEAQIKSNSFFKKTWSRDMVPNKVHDAGCAPQPSPHTFIAKWRTESDACRQVKWIWPVTVSIHHRIDAFYIHQCKLQPVSPAKVTDILFFQFLQKFKLKKMHRHESSMKQCFGCWWCNGNFRASFY